MKARFQTGGDRLRSIPTPVGRMPVSRSEAEALAAMTDDEVLNEVEKGPFVDPFALGEVIRRGIYHKLPSVQRQQENRMTMGDMIQKIIDGSEE